MTRHIIPETSTLVTPLAPRVRPARWPVYMGPFCAALLLAGIACSTSEEDAATRPEGEAAGPAEDLVVATVAGQTITAGQLRKFDSKMPAAVQSKLTGLDRLRNHLQTMIDREILLIEARERGLDQSPGFVRKMAKLKKERLVGLFQAREIKIATDPKEFEEFVAREQHDRAIRFSEIVLASEEEARRARAEIEAGRSFEEVARNRSLNKGTAANGGDRGIFSKKVEMDPSFRDGPFSLEVGEVSQPLRAAGNRYAIVKVTDEMRVELDAMALQQVVGEFQRLKLQEAREELANRLAEEYGLELNQSGVEQFLARARTGRPFTVEEENTIVLYTFGNASIDAGDLVEALANQRRPPGALVDSQRVIEFTRRNVVPDALFMAGAVRAGMDREDAVVAWLEGQRRWLLVAELRTSVLEGQLAVSDDEARAYFDNHAETFADPEKIVMDEVLVATEEEALRLKAQIEKGASIAELADRRSSRSSHHRGEGGRVEFYAFEKAAWGGLEEAAKRAPVGELTGPVEVEGGFSVFRLLSRERRPVSFSEVEKRVVATVRFIRKQEVFERIVTELREKYAPQVKISEDALAAAL